MDHFKDIFENSKEALLFCDESGKILSVNRELGTLLGISSHILVDEDISVIENYLKGGSLKKYFKEMKKGDLKKVVVFKSVNGDKISAILHSKRIDSVSPGFLLTITKNDPENLNHRLISENTSDLISMAKCSMNPVFTYCSPSHKKLLGIDPNDLIGTSCLDLIHPDDKKNLYPMLKKYVGMKIKFLGGKKFEGMESIEFRLKDSEGKYIPMQSTVNIAGDNLLFITKDISDRKGIEEELRASEQRFRTIFDSSAVSIILTDKGENIISCNEFTTTLLGKKKQDLLGKNISSLYPKEEWERIRSQKIRKIGMVPHLETRVFGANKDMINVDVSIKVLKDSTGEVTGSIGVLRDISARKKNESSLLFEREQLLLILDSVNALAYVSDPITFEVLWINKYFKKALGKNPLGKKCFKAFQGKKEPCDFCTNARILKNQEEAYNWEFYNPFLKKHFLLSDRIIRWPDGRLVRFELGIDITDKKSTEMELWSAAKEWSDTFNSMTDGVSIHGVDGTVLNANDALCKILGMEKSKIIGRKCHMLFHKKSHCIDGCPLKLTRKSHKEEHKEIYEPIIDRWLSVIATPIFNKKSEIMKIVHVVRDVTLLKKSEKEIQKRNDDLERFNSFAVGRELMMIKLKQEIKKLSGELEMYKKQ